MRYTVCVDEPNRMFKMEWDSFLVEQKGYVHNGIGCIPGWTEQNCSILNGMEHTPDCFEQNEYVQNGIVCIPNFTGQNGVFKMECYLFLVNLNKVLPLPVTRPEINHKIIQHVTCYSYI